MKISCDIEDGEQKWARH